MPTVDLRDLRRSGRLELDASVPVDAPLWRGTGLALGAPVRLVATVTGSASGQVALSGRASARFSHECRRCLAPLEAALEQPLEVLWWPCTAATGDPGEEADGDVRILEPGATEIDVGEALREELVLAAPSYMVCGEGCRGLCPHCGTDLNEAMCNCAPHEPDPRWDVLRALNRK
ncbi:MAG: DUF177 domain-containing protein [Gammaproteobacteria bacterium]|nr:DUF177 domain-containing protein [Gammaproteobacteria bacterium]MDE0246745.1 DUF177 domain-containing protein [Gammaproteobacteria bacterium]